MATYIKELNGGKFTCRVVIRGRVDTTRSFDNRRAAEAWGKTFTGQECETGKQGILKISEVAEYRDAKKMLGSVDLREVAQFWISRHPQSATITVEVLYERYQESKEWGSCKKCTQGGKRVVLDQFCEHFGSTLLSDVQVEDVYGYVSAIPHKITRNNHIRIIKSFFNWATVVPHVYLSQSPLRSLRGEPEERSLPAIVPVEKVRELFELALKTDTALIPFLALGFFAGIRTSEIQRMEPRDFHFDQKQIVIRPEVAKRRRMGQANVRLLQNLPETLWQWLDAVGFDGTIESTNFVVRRRKLYNSLNITWPNSAARHSFASYAYAKFQNGGLVRTWTGHLGDDSVLLNHYVSHVTQAQGTEYFEILPPEGPITPTRIKTKYENRADWPSDSKLIRWAAVQSKSEIAKRLNVSEAAVRKKLKAIQDE